MALGTTRALVGVSSWLAPDTAMRAFGVDPDRSDRFVGRLFGARDFALGATLLRADTQQLRAVARIGVAVDLVDAVAGIDEYRRGTMSTWALVSGAGGAALLAAMGVAVLREGAPAPAA